MHCTHTATASHKCFPFGSCNLINLLQSSGSNDFGMFCTVVMPVSSRLNQIRTKLPLSFSVCPQFEQGFHRSPVKVNSFREQKDSFWCCFMKPTTIVFRYCIMSPRLQVNLSFSRRTGCLCAPYLQLTDMGHTQWGTGALSTVHTEGTYNPSDRGPLGHCLLYIQRTLTTRQTGGTQSGAH